MKHLRVKWVPETTMTVSLTIAHSDPSVESNQFRVRLGNDMRKTGPCTKFIIISDGNEMRARVMNQTTLQAV